ncbi:MAG TPA: C40 family peptidase [Gaiellaceae bacterium]|jgi:cell wall-associated NlpC family hydrolase|nr:C40 family peptidase [Gaiellaceae bacterium]
MRPIRLLILLLAVALALALALWRPLQVRATRSAKRHGAHPAQLVPKPEPRRHPIARRHHLPRPLGNRVVSYARHFLGIPYSWGGSSPRSGFDCSGLVRFVYGHFGIGLPHSSWADLARGRRITRRSLRPGDLVFFYGASHVGIYAGRGRFIDAPHTGAHVRLSTMHEYAYYGARRFG